MPGLIHNDPIEHHFRYLRGITGSNRHLDSASFLYAGHGLSRHIYNHCRNIDGSHNRKMFEAMFNNIKEGAIKLKTKRSIEMMEKMKSLIRWQFSIEQNSLQDHNISYIGGYTVRKWWFNHSEKNVNAVTTAQ